MTFKEQLNKVNELNINIFDIIIANQCDCVFEFEYNDEQFEKLCVVARRAYLKSEYITANAIAHAINDLIIDEEMTVEDVLSMPTWHLVDKASNYC